MSEIRIKRGETLSLDLQFQQNDLAMDVGHATLSGQVRTAEHGLVANLTLVKQSEPGLVTVDVIDTSQWPCGRLRGDLRMVISGQTDISETFAIVVAPEVTRS